ncbi:putative cytochrome b5 [Rhodotorula toruloides]|nr:putative cytochrome b5 [Rhodotorula toruloides]
MGWMRRGVYAAGLPAEPLDVKDAAKPSVEHIERVDIPAPPSAPPSKRKGARRRTPVTEEELAIAAGGREPVDPDDLPFIPPESISKHNNLEDGLWIIVEDRVYDCTNFLDLHPGGPEVFHQFAGKQCTWQFWKWHSRKHLEPWEESLLIGYTYPVPPNPYPEPKRWIRTGSL